MVTVKDMGFPDTGHGEGCMTQEQWRTRDKSLGLVRVDEKTGEPLPEHEQE